MNTIDAFEKAQAKPKIPVFQPGDTVRVHIKVVEGERTRTQVFQGTVLKRQGKGLKETFTVRKISFGVGVERTFLVHSPMVSKIEVKSRGHVRRAKLYYLRGRVGRKARVKERVRSTEKELSEELAEPTDPAEAKAEEAPEPEDTKKK